MKSFMEYIDFPQEAVSFFAELEKSLTSEADDELTVLEREYSEICRLEWEQGQQELTKLCEKLHAWSEKWGIHKWSGDMLLLLRCAPDAKKRYDAAGIPEEIYRDTMRDLKWKVIECRNVEGVWGTVTFPWFIRHYSLRLFALGRLQFETRSYGGEDIVCAGTEIHNGDRIYGIHIPSAGPMTRELRMDSLRRAKAFFGIPEGKPLVADCWSWLLWPDNRTVYPEGSNLLDFLDDFDIIESVCKAEGFSNAWRVFGMDYHGDVSVLPQKTTLQKNIAARLAAGVSLGEGHGILVFDGERVLTGKHHGE